MRARLAVAVLSLLAPGMGGCFNLATDDQSFCQTTKCGVFVSSSMGNDASGDGTREKPFASLAKALRSAGGTPVYACGEVFEETGTVEVSGAAVVYGARDCQSGWEYKPDVPTTLSGPAGAVALRIGSQLEVSLYDMTIRAAAGASGGQSSIGVVAGEGATVTFERCAIEAGDGAPGADAAAPKGSAADGTVGADGAEACSALIVPGAAGAQTSCAVDFSAGGKGGDGASLATREDDATKAAVTAAASGYPGVDANPNAGADETENALCTPGGDGADGTDGADGAGATGSLGKLGPTRGFTGAAGTAGQSGTPGQGGGGGGGTLGGSGAEQCADAKEDGGASGASGGSGGCGGLGGGGGGAGGASIGIVSLGATLAFSEVRITAGAGARGGNGAEGQSGGAGAAGGKGGTSPVAGLNAACDGGSGGKGGKGGAGGGGRGGHSIGIAHLGEAPSTSGATIAVGAAGPGGSGPAAAGQADGGVAAQVQAF